MLSTIQIILPLVIIILISLPLINVFRGKVNTGSAKRRLLVHIGLFFALILGIILFQLLEAPRLFAAEVAPADPAVDPFRGSIAQGLGFVSAALATGLSALGAGIAVAAAAPAAIGAFSENDKNFGKSLIFVALGEGVAIYGLLISILIIGSL